MMGDTLPSTVNRIPSVNRMPSVSVVVEWENAKLSELGRATLMLRALATQLGELLPAFADPPEVIVLYDAEAIEPGVIREMIGAAFGTPSSVTIRLVPTEGETTYYRQKNRGAGLASREIVLFLDSDVIPEPGWLSALLSHFQHPEVEVVCGSTYIEPVSTYAKAFAAFWFFPLRSDGGEVREVSRFFANNVAFRRALFLAHPFPELPLIRGQCAALADALRRDGHRILRDGRARLSHPPPNGLSHFVRRALSEGHDAAVRRRTGPDAPQGGILRRMVGSVRYAATRLHRFRRELDLSAPQRAWALAVAAGYFGLKAVGEAVSRIDPALVRRRFSV